jgi:hypothetical protein
MLLRFLKNFSYCGKYIVTSKIISQESSTGTPRQALFKLRHSGHRKRLGNQINRPFLSISLIYTILKTKMATNSKTPIQPVWHEEYGLDATK